MAASSRQPSPRRLARGLGELLKLRAEEAEERAGESLIAAGRQAGEWLHRVGRAGELLERLRWREADRVAAPGQWLLLQLRPRGLRSVAASQVRFLLGGAEAGRAEVEPDGVARLPVRAPAEPGLHHLQHELLGPAGVLLADRARAPEAWLQVVPLDAPLLLVEAAWALGEPAAARRLREAAALGVHVAFLAVGDAELEADLRARQRAGELPRAAVLCPQRQSGGEGGAFEEALRGAFVRLAVRRLRAEGLTVVGVLGVAEALQGALREVGLARWGAAELEALLEDGASALHARAAALARERAGEPEARWRLRVMSGARPSGVAEATVTTDNARAREQVLEAIAEARRQVCLQAYIVEDGRVADAFAAELVRAARRGARVRLLVDALYARHHVGPLRNPVLQALEREPGIEVRAVDPPLEGEEVDPLRFKARDHRKLIVVDERLAFVGGRNVGDAYYTGFGEVAVADFTPHERVPWLDAHVRLRGAVVAEVQRLFEEGWRRAGGGAPPERGAPPGVEGRGGEGEAWLVAHDGLGDASALGAYEALFDAARERLLVVNDFPIVDALEAALRRALARGVRVTFLTGSAVARRGDGSFLRGPLYRELFEYMTKHRFEALVRAGADVREACFEGERVVCRGGAVRPYVHAKLVVADGRWVSVGSANLDATASYWEREAIVVLDDPELADRVELQLAPWLRRAHRLRLEDPQWRREAPLRRLAATFWPETLYS